jgi:uncharacterized protein YegP (UPF0339 family)
MKNPKFEIFTGTDSQYYFRLSASNGEIILGSEGYTSKDGCRNGIASVKANAPYDARYEKRDGATYTFVLKAANGEVIGRSESYSTQANRDAGINAVTNTAPLAPTEE